MTVSYVRGLIRKQLNHTHTNPYSHSRTETCVTHRSRVPGKAHRWHQRTPYLLFHCKLPFVPKFIWKGWLGCYHTGYISLTSDQTTNKPSWQKPIFCFWGRKASLYSNYRISFAIDTVDYTVLMRQMGQKRKFTLQIISFLCNRYPLSWEILVDHYQISWLETKINLTREKKNKILCWAETLQDGQESKPRPQVLS